VLFDATVGERTRRVEVRRRNGRFAVTIDGRTLELDWAETGAAFASLVLADRTSHEVALERLGEGVRVHTRHGAIDVVLAPAARGARPAEKRASGPLRLTAPMPGRVVRVLAEAGAEVEAGQGVVVVEAMKMENELRAPRSGRVAEVAVREGQAVETGALLVVIA
jgi:biotin carboxyl carrier protein